jgi:hypothetical protein
VPSPPNEEKNKQTPLILFSEEKEGETYYISYTVSHPPSQADRLAESSNSNGNG